MQNAKNSIINLKYSPKLDEVMEVGWSLHDQVIYYLHCSEYIGGEKRGFQFERPLFRGWNWIETQTHRKRNTNTQI